MSWSLSYVCPDCDQEYVLEDESRDEFRERHEETCPGYEYEGDG